VTDVRWSVVFLVGCGGAQEPAPAPRQLQCTIDGQNESRVMRDCTSELSYQERDLSAKVDAFGLSLDAESGVQYRPVKNSLTLLIEQQRGMCRDWNACALSRREYVARSEWMTAQFTMLTQILDAAMQGPPDPAGRERVLAQVLEWSARAQEMQSQERVETARIAVEAQGVEAQREQNAILDQRSGLEAQSAVAQTDAAGSLGRQATAQEEQARLQAEMLQRQMAAQGQIDAQNAASRANMRAQFGAQADNYERMAGELAAFVPAFARARTELAGFTQGKRPRLCSSSFRRDLETAGRGDNATVADQARRLKEQADRICVRFDKWEQPDADILRDLARIPESLERDEQMAGDRTSSPEPVKAQVIAKIQQARREVAGTEAGRRPFPCLSRVWTELTDLSTQGNGWLNEAASRAVRSRDRVCQGIGVLPRTLEQDAETFGRLIDQFEGQVRGIERQYRDLAVQMRASIPP
jgi:hypothetical protein